MPFFPVGLNKLLYKEAPPQGPTPYPFIHYFCWKSTSFVQFPLTNNTPFTCLIQNEDCKKVGFSPLKSIFLSHPREIFERCTQASQAHSAPGLFFDRSRVLDQRKNTGCFAGPVLNTAISRTTGWFPTCGSSGGFIVNVINDIYR